MSALAVALAAFAATNDLPPVAVHSVAGPSTSPPSRPSSPLSLPSLTHSGTSSSSSSLFDVPAQSSILASDRPNEHLAVLLPKHLWKPDNLATVCDNFYCRVAFSLFERRHHCRKCGGVFCGACTSRTTPLLDTSNLSFLHPPRNIPLSAFESPISPILPCRVCDDCWDQVHGLRSTPHTPSRPTIKRTLSHPIAMLKVPLTSLVLSHRVSDASLSSQLCASPTRLIAPSLSRRTQSLRTCPSVSSLSTSSSSNNTPAGPQRTGGMRTSHLPLPLELERSYGELDAYPLKRSSVVCKATGGGRWEPKQSPILDGYRQPVPGGKAPFEIAMEREEQEEKVRKQNPIVKDGEFRYRFTRPAPEPEPLIVSRSPFVLSTF